jgi:hypothetical protein
MQPGPRVDYANNGRRDVTLGLATTIRLAEVRSLHDDFPLAVPFTTVAAAPIPARVRPRN